MQIALTLMQHIKNNSIGFEIDTVDISDTFVVNEIFITNYQKNIIKLFYYTPDNKYLNYVIG